MTDIIKDSTPSSTPFPALSNFVLLLQKQDMNEALKVGRKLLKAFNEQQFQNFDAHTSVELLIQERTSFVDQLLKKIWKHFIPVTAQSEVSLIAVGGYGRKELQPFSDIDILLISEQCTELEEPFSKLVTFLWDIGFKVGHAIRSFQETIDAAKEDVATATNLLESRWLSGNYEHFQKLQMLWRSKKFWPSEEFYNAKVAEQNQRHKRFNDAFYQLEPNIKESPGGLRDLHTLLWVAKRHFGADSLQELVGRSFISTEEYQEIKSAYLFLNRIRFTLHRLKNRLEDRLLFDNQQQVAHALGYIENDERKAVEHFMSRYYQNVSIIAKLNEILLQHFNEEIFNQGKPVITEINPRFQIVNDYLDVQQDNLFQKNPTALLEIFIILENYTHVIKGIRSRTIRLIRTHLYLIDEQFRKDPINKALFIEIFRQPKGVHAAIQRMHSYGILGAYLPVFQKVCGLMQFNIFHAYTVDEHTILVIRHLRRFFVDDYAYEYPTAHQVAKNLCKPEILILSGLFHDIAKGRGGSHEVLGAEDAKQFSTCHNLTQKDSDLLSWLVLKHLDFSSVAQRKDLSDPEVIQSFAKLVGSQERLDYLYLLTVADVLSTSKEVWNEWKNSLFLQLYNATSKALDKADTIPKDRKKLALYNQEKAKDILMQRNITSQDFQWFWEDFATTHFFTQQSAREIARMTKLLYTQNPQEIYIHIEAKTQKGASELIILMPGRDYLFAHFTHILEQLNLNIVEAKLYTGNENISLVLVYFLDTAHNPVTDENILKQIQETLENGLKQEVPSKTISKALNRRIRCFDTPTEIVFAQLNSKWTELTINTKDIPGLLAKIAQAFKKCKVRVHDAKIHTIGEKAEDVFLISNLNNEALEDEKMQLLLKEELLTAIEC
ncbi:[protein-PII] uridylyltransferase [Thiosulfativibrio zosterae]|uniref:Bifunctional uridylyltransferase/uridylyl-removing enzyme n=1 Tax=Thiosulfativibrio zosterae TaxID=2675053 RepID=A0A6F8PNN0_9GAMM|nr:[protein-PII] uridylyltransferase [Thiosulfativibrio zosterae]BBP43658.1 bifunctional uridylyltransferase/uridylyl-removing enzyme [Thiosulfativibrio zosterae]